MRAGDAVEVTGRDHADFAPDVARARIRVLGHPGLPAPTTGRFGSATWGREDCHWIELEGSCAARRPGKGGRPAHLGLGHESYKAHVLAPAESLAHLLDADVKLPGVCGALFNTKRQMLGIQMFVPERDAFACCGHPLRIPSPCHRLPLRISCSFRGSAIWDIVCDLRGTVTYSNLSGPTWIRDATGGVMIQDHQAAGIGRRRSGGCGGLSGDRSGFGPALRGASVKRLQSGAPPAPVRITVGRTP